MIFLFCYHNKLNANTNRPKTNLPDQLMSIGVEVNVETFITLTELDNAVNVGSSTVAKWKM